MTTSSIITLVVSMIGLIISAIALVFNGIQTRRSAEFLKINIMQAEKSYEQITLNQQIARGNAAMHFTSRFFELLKEGGGKEPMEAINDPNWAYQFWSLHATEFYFFHHCIIPLFMYALWMIELAQIYSGKKGSEVYKSHSQYLQTYSFNYPDMIEFFNTIHSIAQNHTDDNLRNKQVWNYVENWRKANKKLLE